MSKRMSKHGIVSLANCSSDNHHLDILGGPNITRALSLVPNMIMIQFIEIPLTSSLPAILPAQ